MAELIAALDLPDRDSALRFLDRLPGLRWVKVGPVLFVSEGPGFIRELQERELSIFLDLKWLDIPETVAGAVRSADRIGVEMATVHSLGGERMLAAAADAATGVRLLGVTVLTSFTEEEYARAVGVGKRTSIPGEVRRLAELAGRSGLDGVVCSPHEIEVAREVLPRSALIVVPGIRPAGHEEGDQRRTATAGRAAAAGATHLVVGRPLTRADDPAPVYERLLDQVSMNV